VASTPFDQQSARPAQQSGPPPRLRILTIVARPLDLAQLPDLADAWALMDGLRTVQAPVEIAFVRPPTRDRLRVRLAEEWDVIHFDGHGNERALALEQKDGTVDGLPTHEFIRLLKQGKQRPRLVILSACESEALGRALAKAGIPAVIAMRRSVSAKATMDLAKPLYAHLAQGQPPDRALKAARDALPRYEADIPILLAKRGLFRRHKPLCRADGPAGPPTVEHEELGGLPGIGDHGFFYGEFTAEGVEPPGRMTMLREVARLVAARGRGTKLLVLCGEGGIGKTALARAAGRRLAWAFGGRVFYVDGAPLQVAGGLKLAHVLAPFVEVLGPEFGQKSEAEQRAQALAWLNEPGRAALLVVDNADDAEDEVWRFLGDLPRPSAALATHRAERTEGRCLRVRAMRPLEGLGFFWRAAETKGGAVPQPMEHLETEEEKQEH